MEWIKALCAMLVVGVLGAAAVHTTVVDPGKDPSAEAQFNKIAGRVTHVRDGDTIEVGPVAIRLAKLDCAERGTAAGERASRAMHKLVQGIDVTCRLEGRQSYDREVGTCQLQDGRDAGDVMIKRGLCRVYR